MGNFLKTQLDNHSSETGKTEWNTSFDWYFEASKYYQEPEVASLKNEVLR